MLTGGASGVQGRARPQVEPRRAGARRSDDIDAFWDRLEKTGAFHNIQWSDVDVSEEGLHQIHDERRSTAASTAAPRRAPPQAVTR